MVGDFPDDSSRFLAVTFRLPFTLPPGFSLRQGRQDRIFSTVLHFWAGQASGGITSLRSYIPDRPLFFQIPRAAYAPVGKVHSRRYSY